MRPIARRFIVTSLLGLLLIVLLLANSLVTFARLDLTENRIHTISEATRDVVGGFEHELTISYYVSDQLRDRYPQPREIVDLLREYEAAGRGKIRVRVVDPRDLDDEARVEALGLVPQQLQTSDEGEQSVAVVYSGLVVEYLERRESLPFVFGTATLEYELTSALTDLVRDDPRDAVFVLGDRSERLEESYRFVASELARSFDVSARAPGEAIADATEVVVVTDAQRLTAAAVEALEDYLSRGGAVLVAFERVEVDAAGGFGVERVETAPIYRMLRERGIVPGDELLLDESNNRITVQESSEQTSYRVTRTYPYPHWVAVLEQYTSGTHPVTARFNGLDLYWPTRVGVEDDERAEIIAASTPGGWLMREPFVIEPQRDADLRREAEATRGQYGVVAVWTADAPRDQRLAAVSDSDFLRDSLVQATGSAHNVDFARNLVDWLGSDEGLLEIRTRAQRDLSLDAIAEPARERTVRFTARAVNLVVVPATVILFGVARLARRRRRARGRGAS